MPDNAGMLWDIFCTVIDNYGDAGVCWRLAANLAARGQTVRLWLDDASLLHWLAPQPLPEAVQVRQWSQAEAMQTWPQDCAQQNALPDVLIEAFGCEIPQPYLQALRHRWQERARQPDEKSAPQPPAQPLWLNLEYLSAEDYVARMHGLQSPVMFGPATGWSKRFIYPGFTAQTAGLLREPGLLAQRARFNRQAWRQQLLTNCTLADSQKPLTQGLDRACWYSLFCYEPASLGAWLQVLCVGPHPSVVLVAQGRALAAVAQHAPPGLARQLLQQQSAPAGLAGQQPAAQAKPVAMWWGACLLVAMPLTPQPVFDQRLWACDMNLVRGEDSLVRALWAGQPFVWQLYPQDDLAHHDKLAAFLQWAQAPKPISQVFECWNGVRSGAQMADLPVLTAVNHGQWQAFAVQCLEQLAGQQDLASQLLAYAASAGS